MIISFIPILVVDLVGSILMIVLSFLCLLMVGRLKAREPDNLIWTYLLWLCVGLAGFSLSRSAGHILKQILILTDNGPIWRSISPYSGAINTVMFVLVGSVTLFFERVWIIHREILADKKALQTARDELLHMNQNLENLVAERTRELARSEHKYRRIFELSKDMILVSRKDGRIVDLNPFGYQLLGGDKKAVLTGKSVQSFFDRASDWTRLMGIITREGAILNAEIDLKRADGTKIRSLVSGSLDKGSTDSEDTVHFLFKDIERRRQMEQQMAQADKLASIGEFSAGIAHEINNPLGIILGYTQLLLREEPADTERYSDLKTIEKHVRNCKSIVEDLLNFARSSQPEKELVSIHEVIDDVVNFIQQHSRSDKITIEKDYDPKLPALVLDEKKIKQVFMNLIMNARHAVESNGAIRLSTRFDGTSNQVSIKVADTGYGIEKKNLSRIFDPFFTTKPTGEGTGLGLSVSYGIIKSHGGRIEVESAAGKGSVFTITLPVGLKHLRKNA